MLIIIQFGRNILNRIYFLKQHAVYIRKILGILIIASVVFMKYGYGLPNSFTSLGNSNHHLTSTSMTLTNGLSNPYPAPPIADIEAWINSKPLQLSQLNGKVVVNENGTDVKDGILSITHHTLYSLIELQQPSDGTLEIIPEEPGLEIYTFTFGP